MGTYRIFSEGKVCNTMAFLREYNWLEKGKRGFKE